MLDITGFVVSTTNTVRITESAKPKASIILYFIGYDPKIFVFTLPVIVIRLLIFLPTLSAAVAPCSV